MIASIRVLCLSACLLSAAATAAERLVWFGTYTTPPGGSEGIYVARFDTERGTFTKPVLAATAQNPSFLALHPRLPMLYAVSEVTGAAGKPEGGIAAFAVDEQTGTLTPRGGQPSGGGGPCHVAVDPTGKVVLAANYGGGSLICLGLAADGAIEQVATGTPGGFIQHGYDRAGTPGINERRQEKAHAHSVDVSPDGRFAFCCDLGLNQVLVYRLDPAQATLEPHGGATVAVGAGPRHFALHPGGRFAWCVNELDQTVTSFRYDAAAGTLTQIQTLGTLPDDVRDRTGFSCAEIAVHPSGRFLYASTRGHDSIAMYSIDEATGRLTFLGAEPTRAKTPRHFAIAPGGKFLLAAGQSSGTVTVFTIDAATGKLDFTGESVEVPTPVCVLFRP